MKIVLFANTEWYLYNFRRSLALALRDAGLAAGYRWKPDLNAPEGEGISCNPINLRHGIGPDSIAVRKDPKKSGNTVVIDIHYPDDVPQFVEYE